MKKLTGLIYPTIISVVFIRISTMFACLKCFQFKSYCFYKLKVFLFIIQECSQTRPDNFFIERHANKGLMTILKMKNIPSLTVLSKFYNISNFV